MRASSCHPDAPPAMPSAQIYGCEQTEIGLNGQPYAVSAGEVVTPVDGGQSISINGGNLRSALNVADGSADVTFSAGPNVSSITITDRVFRVEAGVDAPSYTAGSIYQVCADDQVPVATPPTVTAISPNSGSTAGGTAVTITGTNFAGATGVNVGGVACTPYTVVSNTSITCTTGAHAAGTASVEVTTPDGTNSTNALYTYTVTVAAPTVTAISPNTGSTAGGTAVTITGTNFTGATSVTVGGVACTPYTVGSPTSITCTTGAHAAGTANVQVTTPNGTTAANTLYTYALYTVSSGGGSDAVQADMLSPTCTGFEAAVFSAVSGNAPNGDPNVYSKLTFTTTCASVTIRMTFPQLIAGRSKFWKFYDGQWHDWTNLVAMDYTNKTVTFTVADQGLGDTEPTQGVITDPVQLSVGPDVGGLTPIPTLSEWGLILLAGLLAMFGMAHVRRRR